MKGENHEYDIKCRKCGKIEKMHFGSKEGTSEKNFRRWALEHGTFPFLQQCDCDKDMIMLHDLVSISY